MFEEQGFKSDYVQEQLDIHREIIAERKAELAELEGNESATATHRREDLVGQIRHSELTMSQIMQNAEAAGHEVGRYEREIDIFGD